MKNRKAFTLIELIIVIAVIALIASIAVPAILSAKRSANSRTALANLKAFSTAMATYSQDRDNQAFPFNTDQMGGYYSHIEIKGGYKYEYKTDKGVHFVYYAQPVSLSTGIKAYFVDESNRIWSSTIKYGYTGANELTPYWDKSGVNRLSKPTPIEESRWKKQL